MQIDSKEGPWPFDSEEERREVLQGFRDLFGVTIQEDGSVLISPRGQSVLGTYLIGTLLLIASPSPSDNPGYAIVKFVIWLITILRVECLDRDR